MPKDILDYEEEEVELPPRIKVLDPPKDRWTVAFIKWGIYLLLVVLLMARSYIDAPEFRKMNTLIVLSLGFFLAFPAVAYFSLNMLLNGAVFIIHWLIISRIQNKRVHQIYSKIYFTTPTSLIFLILAVFILLL